MVGKLTVRRYRKSDRESCRRLWRELTEWHRKIYKDPTIGAPNSENWFDEHLKKVGARNIWVAVLDRRVIGLLGMLFERTEAEMEPVIVDPSYRGKGVGGALVKTAILEARRLGVRYLNVRPVARNAEAIRFFKEMGFENIGRVELFMDFSGKKWRKGIELHDVPFKY
jgi:GNAT superfamily N-acetyltransferase